MYNVRMKKNKVTPASAAIDEGRLYEIGLTRQRHGESRGGFQMDKGSGLQLKARGLILRDNPSKRDVLRDHNFIKHPEAAIKIPFRYRI